MHKTVRMQDITPAIAEKMLTDMKYERQRTVRPEHIKFLANEMKQKRFTSNTIGVCEMPGGTQFMVNGYHTLMAIIESSTTQQLPIEFFHVKSYQDVDKVYARFDRQLKRTRVDTLRVYGLEDSFGLAPTVLSKFAAASVIIMKDFSSGGGLSYVSDDEVVLFMIDWLDDTKKFLNSVAETHLAKLMVGRHILPIGMMTTRYSDKAGEFWNKVSTDDGLAMGDPRKTLHTWIKETGLTKDSGQKRHATLPLGLRSVASAWNAWMEERPLSFIRVVNTTMPLILRSTPYDPKWRPAKK